MSDSEDNAQKHLLGTRHGHCQISLDRDSFLILGGHRGHVGDMKSGDIVLVLIVHSTINFTKYLYSVPVPPKVGMEETP